MTEEHVLKSILRTAIQREADSHALYSHIAAQVKDAGARAKFERLASEEQGHRAIVEKMYAERFGKIDSRPKQAALPDLSDEQRRRANAIDAVKMAIKKEKQSQEFYVDLGEKLAAKEGVELCKKMLEQEQGHEKILEDELRVLTNQFYWYPILDPPWHIKEDL
jgi:rubrerythrin